MSTTETGAGTPTLADRLDRIGYAARHFADDFELLDGSEVFGVITSGEIQWVCFNAAASLRGSPAQGERECERCGTEREWDNLHLHRLILETTLERIDHLLVSSKYAPMDKLVAIDEALAQARPALAGLDPVERDSTVLAARALNVATTPQEEPHG